MMANLLRNIAFLGEQSITSATPTKLYAAMAKAGEFDPHAGMTFGQLVNDAKHKGFIKEATSSGGQKYLQLSM
jgi:hypothetical protein